MHLALKSGCDDSSGIREKLLTKLVQVRYI